MQVQRNNFLTRAMVGLQVILLCIFSLFLLYQLFVSLDKHAFQQTDDIVFSYDTKRLLTTGEFHFAGAKSGIVLMAALFGLAHPVSVVYLFAFFALFFALVMFLYGANIDGNVGLIAAVLWSSSPLFFYLSKTYHIIFCTIYYAGALVCFLGFQQKKDWLYALGWFFLGFALMTHYLLIWYLPFLFLFFLFLWVVQKRSLVDFFKLSLVSGAFPVIFHDTICILAYLIWGKKNWPFLYSLWQQIKSLWCCKTSFGFLYFFKATLRNDWQVIALGILTSLIVLFVTLSKGESSLYEKFLGFLLVPGFFMMLNSAQGGWVALRAFLPSIPVLYLLIAWLLDRFSVSKCRLVVVIVLCLGIVRLYHNEIYRRSEMQSAYADVAFQLNSSAYDFILHVGQQFTWEQLLNKDNAFFLPLDMYPTYFVNPPNPQIVFQKTLGLLYCGKRVAIVRAGAADLHWESAISIFNGICSVNFVKQYYSPHLSPVFCGEFADVCDFERERKVNPPYIYLYEVSLKS